MSTTWVFIGLLAGREIGMSIMRTTDKSVWAALKLGIKDATYAITGLIISIAIAIGVNDQLSLQVMMTELPGQFTDGIVKFFSRLPDFKVIIKWTLISAGLFFGLVFFYERILKRRDHN